MRIHLKWPVCLLFSILTIESPIRADVVLATNTSVSATSGTGVLNNTTYGQGGTVNTNLTYTTNTYSGSNSGAILSIDQAVATTSWGLSGVGAFLPNPSGSFSIGNVTGTNTQTIQSSQALTDFYFIFNSVAVGYYDFSSWTGSVTYLGGKSGITYNSADKKVTIASTTNDNPDGFMVLFSGATLAANTNFSYTVNSNSNDTSHFNVGVAVPEPGTMLLGGIAAVSGGAGVFWKRRRKCEGQPAEESVVA